MLGRPRGAKPARDQPQEESPVTKPRRQIAISTLLGLFLVALSAWLPAMFGELHTFSGSRTEAIREIAYPTYVPGTWAPPDHRQEYLPQAIGYKLSGITTATRSKRDNPVIGVGLWHHGFGWPVAALEYVELTIGDGPGMPTSAEAADLLREFESRAGWRRGIAAPAWLPLEKNPMGGSQATRRLPFAPVWPGFLIVWLFFAALAWLLLFLPGVMLRKRRFRRGLCLNCGYPLGTETCSECGHVHAARLIPSS